VTLSLAPFSPLPSYPSPVNGVSRFTTSTFDVIAYLDSGSTGLPGKSQVASPTLLPGIQPVEFFCSLATVIHFVQQCAILCHTTVFERQFFLLKILKDGEDAFLAKYKTLNEAIVGVVEDYSLVSFVPLHVEVCEPSYNITCEW